MFPNRRSFLLGLAAIRWSAFETAYGSGIFVPWWLLIFRFAPRALALKAGHKLDCSLCHQHAYVSSAALPAASFILDTLERPEPAVVDEALFHLLGYVECTDPRTKNAPAWHGELRALVRSALPRIRRFAEDADAEVADTARLLLSEVAEQDSGNGGLG